jgi:NAD(P)-dependent dehydrogenase (short-subunit alcohol dehydrogenase family)
VNKTVLISGGSSGIGLAAAVGFARRGDTVVLIGRHPGRLDRAVEAVREAGKGRTPAAYRADFARLDEVRSVAADIARDVDRIDVFANNAGLLPPWPGAASADGLDLTIQVNHLAGFLLANLLHPILARSRARIVTTGSLAEAWGWLDVDHPGARRWRYRSRWLAYGSSKQANLLFTVAAAERWAVDGITAVCYFPGLVRSRFGRTSPLFTLGRIVPVLVGSARRGADTLLWLTETDDIRSGGYYFLRNEFGAMPWSISPRRAARLWTASLAAVGEPPIGVAAAPGTARPDA